MKLNNNLYNVLKWICITASPALATLVTGLGLLYGFDSAINVGTITLAITFVGTLIGISSVNYAKLQEEKTEPTEEE